MTRREYRKRWLSYHDRYQRRGLRIFRKAIRGTVSKVPLDNLSKYTYPELIQMNITEDQILDAYTDFYLSVGLTHGKRVGSEVNKQLKRFEVGFFDAAFRKAVRSWLMQNAGARITSVRSALIKTLVDFIADSIGEGLTIDEVTRKVKKFVLSRGFYRWQIERIVRTETTAAANYGASVAGDVSGVKMVKEWVSSMDGRTRRRPEDQFDHWVMDGARVAKDDFFDVQGEKLLFPGDPNPKIAAGAVINCRCTVGLIPQRDANGDLVFT